MKHLIAIADIIEAAGIATKGTDLFIGTMPGTATKGTMIRPPLTGVDIDEGLRGFYEGNVMVIVRDPSYSGGYDKALALQGALKKSEFTQGDTYFAWMRPTELPVSYPRGDSDGIETAFELQVGFGYI